MKKLKNRKLKYCVSLALLAATFFASGVAVFNHSDVNAETNSVSPASLWASSGNGAVISENVDVPDIAKSGYISQEGTITFVEEGDLEDWQTNGVMVSTTSAMDYVTFNNIIDLDGFTKEDKLIDVLPISSNPRLDFDFNQMTITFTDADDENNWFSVYLMSNPITNSATSNYASAHTWVKVNASNGVSAGYRYGQKAILPTQWHSLGMEIGVGAFHNVVRGRGKGKENSEMLVMPYSLRYDANDKSVWMVNDNNVLQCILDLDDTSIPNAYGGGTEWAGFTNNRVKVSIEIGGITNTPASYVILNLANTPMNGDTATDTISPSYLTDYDNENIPKANVGMEYPLFDVEFYDTVSGDIQPVVYIKKPKANEFLKEAFTTSFVPDVEGYYTLRYVGRDAAGNQIYKDFVLYATYAISPIELEIEEHATDFSVGEFVLLPKATVSGGSGNVALTTQVRCLADNSLIGENLEYFIPTFAGDYSVTYIAKDYLGREKTYGYVCSVKQELGPVFESEMRMYPRMISGVAVRLPNPNAYDYYSLPGQKLNAINKITVKGVGEKASVVEEIHDYQFVPSIEKFGDQITVEYEVWCRDYTDVKETRSFNVELIDPKNAYLWDYFDYDDQNVAVTYNGEEDEEKYLGFKMNEGQDCAQISYFNPLYTETLDFRFSVDKIQEQTKINLSLIDFINSNKTVEIEFSQADENTIQVKCNGKSNTVVGQLTAAEGTLFFIKDKTLYTGSTSAPTKVLSLESVYDFSNKLAWVEIEVVSAPTETNLRLYRLGTLTLRADYLRGNVKKYSLTLFPSVIMLDNMPTEANFGEKVELPLADVYDMFSTVNTFDYEVTKPDGSVVSGEVTKDASFIADVYGQYSIKFIAKNAYERSTPLEYTLYVFDKSAPRIAYFGETEITCSVGETVKFTSASVYDSFDTEPQLYVFVTERDLGVKNVTDTMEYTFTQKGTYTVRYYACDAAYNHDVVKITVTVR